MVTLQEKLVRRALRATDPSLYLVERWDSRGYPYWVIMSPIGEGFRPMIAVDWRSEDKPLPLSLNIIDQLRRQEGDVRETIQQATAANRALQAKAREERMAQRQDLIQEYHRWDKRGFVKIPKGVSSD